MSRLVLFNKPYGVLSQFTPEAGHRCLSDFIPVPSVDVDQLLTRVGQMLRGMRCPHLRNLAECFLMDDVFIRKFSLAPAGSLITGAECLNACCRRESTK